MRFLEKKGIETYLTAITNDDARFALNVRLNMASWIEENFGKERCCPLCNSGEDTTEHVFNCEATENRMGVTVKDLENGEKMADIVKLFKTSEEKRRMWLLDGIQLNLWNESCEEAQQ